MCSKRRSTVVTFKPNGPAGPNLFLVGAAKAGTTSLAAYLDQHPQVFVSRPKEPNFFALPLQESPQCIGPMATDRLSELLLGHSVTNSDAYQQLFMGAQDIPVRADASVRYLYSQDAPQRIHDYDPTSKIVAILRDPVDRMHSHYHMNVRLGVEPESFGRALALEDDRVANRWGWDWHYVRVGQYAEQLKRYFDAFGRDQMMVLFYDDFCRDPIQCVRDIARFVGVDVDICPDTHEKANVGQTPRYRLARRLIWEDNPVKSISKWIVPRRVRRKVSEWVESRNRQPVPPLNAEARVKLARHFESDRESLQTLLQREIPW